MKKLLIIAFLFPIGLLAQVGIGTTTPDASSALEISSTNSGVLIPRMTQVQRDAIVMPATGLLIYQTDNTPGFYYYTGAIWSPFGGADNDWTMHANGTDMYNANSGNVGLGTNAPTTKLHIEDVGGVPADLVQDFETAISPFTGDWILQGTNVNGGVQAVSSAAIGDLTSSSMEITVNISIASTVSFFKEVSSEGGFDFLRFYIDGVEFGGGWSGTIGYSQESFVLTAGVHTLKWEYSKDVNTANGADAAYVDDVVITNVVPAGAAMRIVDGGQAAGSVLTSDANGNASWQPLTNSSITDIPLLTSFQGMEIPLCDFVVIGSTGNFNVTIQGVVTTVNWEVLDRSTTIGTTVVISGNEVLLAPHNPERLQVRYDFAPDLPFAPNGLLFTANNTSSYPDTFSLNYAAKSATSITMNITRTDRFGENNGGTVNCWRGQFYFDVLMTD